MRDDAFGLSFKSIDNSRVVREVDPRANRDLWWLLLLMSVLVGGILFYAWPHLQLRRTGIATECLRGQADAPISHDNYFHAVLGLMQVRTAVYRRALDPYAGCASH